MLRFFCTYFDRNYFVKGLALIESLKKYSESDIKIFVVCMDEISKLLLDKLNYPYVVTVSMHTIEQGDTKLLECKNNRDHVEYLWTTTPSIIYKILSLHPEIDILTYVDADLYFYSSFEPIYNELGSKSVLIHPHRFPEKYKHQEKYGIFNVGLLCFRNNSEGHEVLSWWRERCIEWCYKEEDNGKFGDQGYLNDWPERFPQTAVSMHLGIGVAPWNDDQYTFTSSNGTPMVNSDKIIFYHYHAFNVINPYLYIPAKDPAYSPSKELFLFCVLPYAKHLFELILKVQNLNPDFNFGILNNDFQLSPQHGLLGHISLKSQIAELNLPQKPEQVDVDWNLYL